MIRAMSSVVCVGALVAAGMWVWNSTGGDPTPEKLYELSRSQVDNANELAEGVREFADRHLPKKPRRDRD